MTRRTLAVLALCSIALLPLVAGAAEASLDAQVNSAYLWRGQLLNDEAVFQPSLTVSTDYGLSFNTWGSFNLTDSLGEDADQEFTEVDLTVSYALPIEAVDAEIGVAEYVFPHATTVVFAEDESTIAAVSYPDTREVFARLGLKTLLAPTLYVAYDFDEAEAFYGSIGVSHGVDVTEAFNAELALSLGAGDSDYNLYYFGIDDEALNDATATLTLTYAISESVSLGGYVTYMKLVDSDIEDAADATYFNDGDEVVGGGTLSYTF